MLIYYLPSSRMPCSNSTTEWELPDSPIAANILQSPEWNQRNPSPSCQCSTSKKLTMMPICPIGAGGLSPRQRIEATGDTMLDLTQRNISDYLVKTYPSLIRTRQVDTCIKDRTCKHYIKKPIEVYKNAVNRT